MGYRNKLRGEEVIDQIVIGHEETQSQEHWASEIIPLIDREGG